ncbi:uncharacterized protein O3C94_022810 [Discoglossus pictus]
MPTCFITSILDLIIYQLVDFKKVEAFFPLKPLWKVPRDFPPPWFPELIEVCPIKSHLFQYEGQNDFITIHHHREDSLAQQNSPETKGNSFMDAPDGRTSPEYRGTNTSRNGSEENNALPSHLPPKEGETIDGPPLGYGVHPPPAMRIPLLPVDPRGPFFRRPFPPPPHPMEMYGPRDYPGMPPMPMRHPNPQLYPPFPVHGDPYFPPPHLRPPPPRSDHPTEPAPSPNSEKQDQQPEPHT